MDQIVLDIAPNAALHVTSIAGDLRVTGWDRPQLAAEGDGNNKLHVDQAGDAIQIRADSDCTLRVPRTVALRLDSVSGDARIKNLDGALTIHRISGELVLRQVGPVEVHSVASDLSAKKVAGHLRAQSVSGDLLARSVAGDFLAGSVSGDLFLRDVEGSVRAEASGDVTLNLDFDPAHEYTVRASGDMVVRLGGDANGRFELQSASDINVDVTGAQMEGQSNRRVVTLGSGAPVVKLEASGDIVLTGQSADPDAWGDFGDRFGEDIGLMAEELASQFTSHADVDRILSERLAHLNVAAHIRTDEIAAKARRAAERVQQAQRRAQREVESAQRRAQREAERAQRHVEAAQRRAEAAQRRAELRHGEHARRGTWAFGFTAPPHPPVPPTPPVPPVEPVSDDERMVILRMVEQGKITVADAEKLLAALEGK
jgi:hypothetical protein